jgi:hypothetical protein
VKEHTAERRERVEDDETGIKASGDQAKARDEVNYIMHMTGGRQYKKQSAGDGGMPPLN